MGQPGGARRPAVIGLAVLAAAALSLLRQTGAGALDTVYAEDGTVFLADVYERSTLDALFTPYAGYLHLIPRILAELVSLLPLSAASAALAISAALVTGGFTVLVYVASASVLRSPWARVLVSSVVVLVPVGQDEVPNSIANLHWPALYVLFWLLLWRPATQAGRALATGTVLLIVLSDVLSVVFLPLAAWRWWRTREPALGIAMLAGLAAQAAAIVFGPGGREFAPEPLMWVPWWVIRAVPTGLLGQRWFGSDVDTTWLILAALAWVAIAAAVLAGWRRRGGVEPQSIGVSMPILAVVAALHCVALYALPVALSGQATPRYVVAPAMLLVTALVAVTLEQPMAFGALAALCLVVWAINFRVPNARSDGPLWSDELPRATVGCTSAARVPITPAGWELKVPCQG